MLRSLLWQHGNVFAKPQKKGGLGVIRLCLQNDALLMKNIFKLYSRADLPWVNLIWSQYYSNVRALGNLGKGSFWWRSIMKLLNNYKQIAMADFDRGENLVLA
jgi:hypothetical protein